MPQTINLTVTGLCLFVPGGDGRMYLLLPATGPDAGDGSVPPHAPVLRFAPGTVASGNKQGLALAGKELRFGLDGGTLDPSFPTGVVDLRRYTGTGPSQALLAGGGDGVLASRLSFPAGALRTSGALSCWTMRRPDGGDEPTSFTNQVVWTATRDYDALPLVIRGGPLGSRRATPLVTFRPDIPVLNLTLSHDVTHDPHGHCEVVPPFGAENEHFQAYRWLMDDWAGWQLPRFAGLGACEAGGGVFAHGGTAYTCLIGGSTLPPAVG